jgi:hypothetical protein
MPDFSKLKLGKGPAWPQLLDKKRLKVADFASILPAAPDDQDYTKGITNWGMLDNDTLGDCTIADIIHGIQVWMTNVGVPWPTMDVLTQVALDYYEWWCGYVPGNPNTDNGGVIVDQLNRWLAKGFNYHKLMGYADPQITNLTHVAQSINLFGGVSIGLLLPVTAQNQEVWDIVGDPTDQESPAYPGSWGGHATYVPKYNSLSSGLSPTCITWSVLMPMTERFWLTYVDEVHALFGKMWMEKSVAPGGFDWTLMFKYLPQVGN